MHCISTSNAWAQGNVGPQAEILARFADLRFILDADLHSASTTPLRGRRSMSFHSSASTTKHQALDIKPQASTLPRWAHNEFIRKRVQLAGEQHRGPATHNYVTPQSGRECPLPPTRMNDATGGDHPRNESLPVAKSQPHHHDQPTQLCHCLWRPSDGAKPVKAFERTQLISSSALEQAYGTHSRVRLDDQQSSGDGRDSPESPHEDDMQHDEDKEVPEGPTVTDAEILAYYLYYNGALSRSSCQVHN